MGMGIPVGMGFPWESHGNGNTFGLWTGMGMGILSREWEWRIFLYVKKFPLLVTPNVSRELTSFLTQQHAVTDEEEN